jgi:hypothetical protein
MTVVAGISITMRLRAGSSTQSTTTIMKRSTSLLLLAASLVIGAALTSCVVPADAYGITSTTYSTYEPGYRTTSLPRGYRSEVISGNTYYYNNGSYYRPQSGGYVVVDAPRTSRYYSDYDSRRTTTTYRDGRTGDVRVITTLPSGYRELNHRGTSYYQAGDQYYHREGSGYITVSRPY